MGQDLRRRQVERYQKQRQVHFSVHSTKTLLDQPVVCETQILADLIPTSTMPNAGDELDLHLVPDGTFRLAQGERTIAEGKSIDADVAAAILTNGRIARVRVVQTRPLSGVVYFKILG